MYEYILQCKVEDGVGQPYIEEHTIYADSDEQASEKAGRLVLNSDTMSFVDAHLYAGVHELDVITGKRYS